MTEQERKGFALFHGKAKKIVTATRDGDWHAEVFDEQSGQRIECHGITGENPHVAMYWMARVLWSQVSGQTRS